MNIQKHMAFQQVLIHSVLYKAIGILLQILSGAYCKELFSLNSGNRFDASDVPSDLMLFIIPSQRS